MVIYQMDVEGLLKHTLWVDKANALEVLQQKIITESLDEQQAAWIAQFITQGYCILPKAIPKETLGAAWADLENAYQANTALRCHKQGVGAFSSQEAPQLGITGRHYSVHDFHNLSTAALTIATHSAYAKVLKTILNAHPILMQSQMFLYGSSKGAHCDFPYYLLRKPLHSATVWVAGESVTAASGALYLYPQSQHLPPYEFPNHNVLWIQGEDLAEIDRYHWGLTAQCEAFGIEKQLFTAEAGDVLLFNSRLIHGALPPANPTLTRRSFVFHFSVPDIYTQDHLVDESQSQLRQQNAVLYYERTKYPISSHFQATPT